MQTNSAAAAAFKPKKLIRQVSETKTSRHESISLHEACREGELETVKEILGKNEQLAVEPDRKGVTPLQYAACGGNIEIFKCILNHAGPTAIQMITRHSFSHLLHFAAKSGKKEFLEYLFTEYPDQMESYLLTCNKNKKIPAHYAIKSGCLEAFEYLYNKNPSGNRNKCKTSKAETFYTIAAKTGDLALVSAISEKYAFVKLTSPSKLLGSAIASGNLEIVKFVERSWPPTMGPYQKPLIYDEKLYVFDAIKTGQLEMVKYLISHKNRFSLNETKKHLKFEFNPVGYAAFLGLTTIMHEFLRAEVGCQTNSDTLSLILCAAYGGHKETFQEVYELELQSKEKLEILQTKHKGEKNIFYFAAQKPSRCSYKEALSFFEFILDHFNQEENLKIIDELLNHSVLEIACKFDNLDVFKFLINRKDIEPSELSELCCTSLGKNHWDLAKVFFDNPKHNQSLNLLITDKTKTPLFQYLYRFCRDTDLITKATNLMKTKGNWQTGLENALKYGNEVTSGHLLNCTEIQFESTNLFFWAAQGGSVAAMEHVVKRFSINYNEALSQFCKDKMAKVFAAPTALHFAINFQHLEMTQFLIEKRANVNLCKQQGYPTPLHVACKPLGGSQRATNCSKIVELLLQNSACPSLNEETVFYPNMKGETYFTPYDIANKEIRKLLELKYPRASSLGSIISLDQAIDSIPQFEKLFTADKRMGGYFGNVARATYCGTPVMIKSLKLTRKKQGKEDEIPYHILEREFLYEVALLTKIRHPNCCQLIAACYDEMGNSDKPKFLFIMEQLDMDARRATKEHKLSIDDCVTVTQKICSAMNFLHQQNPPIIHKDLKPDNILVSFTRTPRGEEVLSSVKLADFGISFVLGGEKSSYNNLINEKLPGKQTDIFLFGNCIAQLFDVNFTYITEPTDCKICLPRDVPELIIDIIYRCLSKTNPFDSFATIDSKLKLSAAEICPNGFIPGSTSPPRDSPYPNSTEDQNYSLNYTCE